MIWGAAVHSGRHGRCLCGVRSMWQLLTYILVHQRTEMGQEAGQDYKTQGSLPSNPLSLFRIHLPKVAQCHHIVPLAGVWVFKYLSLWGTFHIQTTACFFWHPCQHLVLPSCRTVGICCSSSAQMSLPLFLSVGMIKPRLPQADQEEAEIASDVVVDDEQLDPGSDSDM